MARHNRLVGLVLLAALVVAVVASIGTARTSNDTVDERRMTVAAGVAVYCVDELLWPDGDLALAHGTVPGGELYGYPAPSVLIRDSFCNPMTRVYRHDRGHRIGLKPMGGWFALAVEAARVHCVLGTAPCPDPPAHPHPELMLPTPENLQAWRYSSIALRTLTTTLYRADVGPRSYRMFLRDDFEAWWLCQNYPPPPGYDKPPMCPWDDWELQFTAGGDGKGEHAG